MENAKTLVLILLVVGSLLGCQSNSQVNNNSTNLINENAFLPNENSRKEIQEAFQKAKSGDTLYFGEGTFELDLGLSLLDKENITLIGSGQDKTILSFKNQKEGASGAEGIIGKNLKNFVIQDLAVVETKGDAIKVQDSDGVSFINVRTEWEGAKATNGAYGLYPVTCSNVLIDGCIARGASDAGIYVGQSKNIIVKNCLAERNVAGIEIENSTDADVFDNTAQDNTGGILVFDLPDLPVKDGKNIRVFNNTIIKNNQKNFAPEGNIVASVPAGTGVMVMAAENVEVFENKIEDNGTINFTVISYLITGNPIKDESYDPYPYGIYVHDNQFKQSKEFNPDPDTEMGQQLSLLKLASKTYPDIIHDGMLNPDVAKSIAALPQEKRFCFQNNGEIMILNLEDMEGDTKVYDCSLNAVSEVNL